MHSSIRISAFTQTFSGSVCFAFLPYIFLFSPLTEILSKLISHIPTFFTVLVPVLLFPTDLPKSSSCFHCPAKPTTQGLRKAALLLPTCAVLITSVARRSADWYFLKHKHICLAAGSWSVNPTATPTKTE